MNKKSKRLLEEIRDALFEASTVLEDVGLLDEHELPVSFRYALTDELHGLGLMVQDILEENK
jgi:hypothetical protein